MPRLHLGGLRNSFLASGYSIATMLVLAIVLGVRECARYGDRKWDQRLAQAAAFKREFDQRFPAGARQADVDAYFQSRTIDVKKYLTSDRPDDPTYLGEYFIVVSRAKSRAWYCEIDFVGVKATFGGDGHLRKSEVEA